MPKFTETAFGASMGAGALDFLGSVWSAGKSRDEAKRQMDFQKDMYMNRYQMTMADMEKAGLNPIFAYQGIGSGSPTGAMAQINNPMSSAINSANSTRQTEAKSKTEYMVQHHLASQIALNSQGVLTGEMVENMNRNLSELYRAEAANAWQINDALKVEKELHKRDARYKLDNPALMKVKEWASAFGSILGGGNSAKSLLKGK